MSRRAVAVALPLTHGQLISTTDSQCSTAVSRSFVVASYNQFTNSLAVLQQSNC